MAAPWKLALIAGDDDAIKVATAYYALPDKRRGDLDRIAELAGVESGVETILTRLRTAGMLQKGPPPDILVSMINNYVVPRLARKG